MEYWEGLLKITTFILLCGNSKAGDPNWFLFNRSVFRVAPSVLLNVSYVELVVKGLRVATLLGTITYPIPAGTFESMIFQNSHLARSLEGNG